MCKILNISRSLIYYKRKNKRIDKKIENEIIRIFKESRNNYGSRKIKVKLQELGYQVSLRRIRKIMDLNGLVSNYTVKQFKVHKASCNEEEGENILNREFEREKQLDVVVSDLTYVNVAGKWNYICLILDLWNREIIGYAAGIHKDAKLVYKAFSKISYDLRKINIFHTDRGNEFKNKIIEELNQKMLHFENLTKEIARQNELKELELGLKEAPTNKTGYASVDKPWLKFFNKNANILQLFLLTHTH